MRISRCGLPPTGGEAYGRNVFIKHYLHIILYTNRNYYHSNCLDYSISSNFEQKRIKQKNRHICKLDG